MQQVKTRNGNGSKCCSYLFSGEGPARDVFLACIGQEHAKEKSRRRKDKRKKEKKEKNGERGERKNTSAWPCRFCLFPHQQAPCFCCRLPQSLRGRPRACSTPNRVNQRQGRTKAPPANQMRPLPLPGSPISALPSIRALAGSTHHITTTKNTRAASEPLPPSFFHSRCCRLRERRDLDCWKKKRNGYRARVKS